MVARGVVTVLEKLELEFRSKTSGSGRHTLPDSNRNGATASEKIRKFVYAVGKLIEAKAKPELSYGMQNAGISQKGARVRRFPTKWPS